MTENIFGGKADNINIVNNGSEGIGKGGIFESINIGKGDTLNGGVPDALLNIFKGIGICNEDLGADVSVREACSGLPEKVGGDEQNLPGFFGGI